jgi:hypothetical protein
MPCALRPASGGAFTSAGSAAPAGGACIGDIELRRTTRAELAAVEARSADAPEPRSNGGCDPGKADGTVSATASAASCSVLVAAPFGRAGGVCACCVSAEGAASGRERRPARICRAIAFKVSASLRVASAVVGAGGGGAESAGSVAAPVSFCFGERLQQSGVLS